MQEIDLSIYIKFLWKQKKSIMAGSIIPAMVVGVIIYAMPTKKNTVYSYNLDWTIAEYLLAQEYFNSNASIEHLANQLQGTNSGDYANELRRMQSLGTSRSLVSLNTYPPLTEKDTSLSRPEQDKVRLATITLQVVTRKHGEMTDIAVAVRKHFESSFALTMLRDKNKQYAQGLFHDNLALEQSLSQETRKLEAIRSQLQSLRELNRTAASRPATEDIVMPLLVGRKEFFPIEYQVRAIEIEIAAQERILKQVQDNLALGQKRLTLALELSKYIEDGLSKGLNVEQYLEYLAGLVATNKADKDFAGCMTVHLTDAQMMDLRNWRVSEVPNLYHIPKHTVAITASVLVGLLLLMAALSVLRMGLPARSVGS